MNGSQEADIPMLSANDDVAAVQQSYWDVLTGKASTLTIPGEISDKETEALLDGEDSKMLSANDDVAAVQQSYWDVLTGKASTLTIPGEISDKETEALLDGEDSKLDDRVFTGDEHSDWPSLVRRHAGLVVDSMIGTYEPGGTGLDDNLRFDPDGRVFTGDEHSDWPSLVRRHAGLVVDSMIGTYEPGGTGLDDNLRFDPDGVAIR